MTTESLLTTEYVLSHCDVVVSAGIDAFNAFDNNGISAVTSWWRFVDGSDFTLISEDFALFGAFGALLALITFGIELTYNYRYRVAWDAYLERELDRSSVKIYDRLCALRVNFEKLTFENKPSFQKFALLLKEYEEDTENVETHLSADNPHFGKKIKEVKEEIARLREKIPQSEIQANADKLTELGGDRSTNPTPNDSAKINKEALLFLQKNAKRRKAKIQDHLESDPYLIAQFSDSPWFKVPFAYAWGYWFVYFFTVMFAAVASFVPLTWALLAFICPLLYLGYKEIVYYQMRFVEEPITLENLCLKENVKPLNLDINRDAHLIERLLQLRAQDLVLLTEEEIKLIISTVKQEKAQKRRQTALKLCNEFGLEGTEVDQFEQLEKLWQKLRVWKKQQSQISSSSFRAGWLFIAAVAGVSAGLLCGFSVIPAILLGIHVGAGVLLFAFVLTRLIDWMGRKRCSATKEKAQLSKEQEDAKEKTQTTVDESKLKEQQDALKNAQEFAGKSTKEWAFEREQLQKKMMLELSEIERAIALEAWKLNNKNYLSQINSETADGGEAHSPNSPPDGSLNLLDQSAIINLVKSFTTPLERVRRFVVSGLEFFAGYMFGYIIGFVAIDFLTHIPGLAVFADVFLSNFLVGALSLLTGVSHARRAWLNEHAHLSDLEIGRLNENYLRKQPQLEACEKENKNLRDSLKARIADLTTQNKNEDLKGLERFIDKPRKKFVFKSHKVLNVVRKVLFVLTSVSTVILMSRAVIVWGFSRAFQSLTVSGSLVLFGAAGINPLGVAVLSLAAVFLLWRVVNRMYMAAEKEQEAEKIACIDRRLGEAEMENTHLREVEKIINPTKKLSLDNASALRGEVETPTDKLFLPFPVVVDGDEEESLDNDDPLEAKVPIMGVAGGEALALFVPVPPTLSS